MAAKAATQNKERKTARTGKVSNILSDDAARLIIDEQGRIAFASPSFSKMAGLGKTSITGRDLHDIIAFADPDSALRAPSFGAGAKDQGWSDTICEGAHDLFINGDETPHPFHFNRVNLKDGQNYVVAAAISDPTAQSMADVDDNLHAAVETLLFPDNQGKATAATTKSGKAKSSLQKGKTSRKVSANSNEGEIRHFLNMSHDAMVILNAEGYFIRANKTFNTILGFGDEELKTTGFLDLVMDEDRTYVRPLLKSLMRAEETGDDQLIDFEARTIDTEGEVHWIDWRLKRFDGLIYAVGRDLSEIKRHELALSRHEQQLREAQAIGNMGHWYWRVGEDWIDWSDEIYRIFGTTRQDFTPTLESVNKHLHKRDLGRMLQAFQRAIIEQNDYEMDFRILRPDGEKRYIRCQGRCEKDSDGEVIALFGIMQDITERTQYERQLEEAKEAAERAYAAKSQFLANMSHELRTPLNAIIGFSEMIQRQMLGPLGNDRYLDYINGVRESGEHLLDLISDILDMSKIEAGKYELDIEEFNLTDLIGTATHMMEGRALDAEVRLGTQLDNQDLVIKADRRAVMQILLNLVSNAVKFTEAGGEINVICTERDGYISLKVQDTGIGIPASKLRSITRPFEQAASHFTRDHEGSGLGLSITKDLVELHGGSLHIESTVGVGTTVTVRLPYDATGTRRDKRKVE